jgi:hypothetical protein
MYGNKFVGELSQWIDEDLEPYYKRRCL